MHRKFHANNSLAISISLLDTAALSKAIASHDNPKKLLGNSFFETKFNYRTWRMNVSCACTNQHLFRKPRHCLLLETGPWNWARTRSNTHKLKYLALHGTNTIKMATNLRLSTILCFPYFFMFCHKRGAGFQILYLSIKKCYDFRPYSIHSNTSI